VDLRNDFANFTCSVKPAQIPGITKKDAVSKRDDISLKNSSFTYDLIAGLSPSLSLRIPSILESVSKWF
ncbi:MAG: hypothetical protein F6K22_08380, partial [Okeania sp. SIO2F4]|uniref:hypothetical protein n=1 Tax=Okeania sp. SIO2F4 TaxID=2607790 RepID=UPI001428E0E5